MLKEKSKESQMTEFGRAVLSLMLTRGIETRQDLRAKLNEAGYAISQARVSYYLNGDRAVDPMFLLCVTSLLGLTKEEQRKLSWSYAYGQKRLDGEDAAILEKLKTL